MKRTYLLPAAYLLDQVAGDPEWFPHPVRLMGSAISNGERLLRNSDDSSEQELLLGAVLTFAVVAGSYLSTRTILRLSYARNNMLGAFAEVFLGWTCLAAKNLQQEAEAVSDALMQSDLPRARKQLARIVGRDTEYLDAAEVSRALVETLAESASDGIMSPIFYMALGGVPLAMAYKAINTLDSMIGHRDARYLYFGKVAARLDDVANYIPARITAMTLVGGAALLLETFPRTSFNTWLRDGGNHKSPNAGQPEAAMAGALQVRLGGVNHYGGERLPAPVMGEEFPASTPEKAQDAIRLTTVAAMLGLVIGTLLAAAASRRKSS